MAFVLVALGALPPMAFPQAQGGEIRVNSYTTGYQAGSRIAATPDGGFIVVWDSTHEGGPDAPGGFGGAGPLGIFARRFNAIGGPLGPEFAVNELTTGAQLTPAVAVGPGGDFVVVWTGYGDGGAGSYGTGAYGIFARQFTADGTPLGGDFQVNTYTTSYQGGSPSVASASESGDFVVVWTSGYAGEAQDGSSYGVFGRQFAASGAPLGDEFQVNTYTTGSQTAPAVASAPSGDFTVVWESPQDGSGLGVIGQRFAANGAPQGGEFQVNTYTGGNQNGPSVAAAEDGDFIVAWTSRGLGAGGQDGSFFGVFGQGFDGSGTPLGAEFRVNTYTLGNQFGASVASNREGDFVVTWTSLGQDGSADGVFGQAFAAGARSGGEFRVNAYTSGPQYGSRVAVRPNGTFVVTWESYGQDGSDGGVFGRRFAKPRKKTKAPGELSPR